MQKPHTRIHILDQGVWDDVLCLTEGPFADHIQHLALEWDQVPGQFNIVSYHFNLCLLTCQAARQDVIEC